MASAGILYAQGSPALSSQFDLADNVQLDQVDNAVLAQWDRAKTLLADRQWGEAVEILRQLAESSDGKLVGLTDRRYVNLRAWCQLQLAALPADALRLYRARVDPIAQQWYEQGIAERNPRLLRNVVEQAFASRYGDDALMALGEIALESGDYTAARWYWERILPVTPPAGTPHTWPGYPDTDVDLATVRARLVLASILEGATDRAKSESAAFARLHPDARGRLGGHEGVYAQRLKKLLAESTSWPALPSDPNWPTFAGNPQRNQIASSLADVGSVVWRHSMAGNAHLKPLGYHPIFVGNTILINDSQRILALQFDTGKPTWGQATIYESQLAGVIEPALPSDMLGTPRYTMTVFQNKLFARMGSPITAQPQESSALFQPGCLVCLDLSAEGRLLWKAEPEEGFAFEGSPVVDAGGVYVAMRSQDIRPRAFVACFDPDTGRPRWRRFICGAETPSRGLVCECTHNLLTLNEGVLYFNTNLGAVAAIRADDGLPLWVSLYPRDRHGNIAKLAPHWQRDLNPCIFDRGELLVAPADSLRIFALDAASGQMLWQTGSEVEDAVDLLGVTDDWLIAGGGRLYWISRREEDRGRVKHLWPNGPDRSGYGRGLLAGDAVLWPTRDKLFIFDQQTAEPRKTIDLAIRGVSGGNLVVADGRLLIATEKEIIAIESHGEKINKGPGL
jgi:outer membrane protein assembly factor BamB